MSYKAILTDETGKEIVAELKKHNFGRDLALPVKATMSLVKNEDGQTVGATLQVDSDLEEVFALYDTDASYVPVLWVTDQETGARFFVPFVLYDEAGGGAIRRFTFGTFDINNTYGRMMKAEIRYQPVLNPPVFTSTTLL